MACETSTSLLESSLYFQADIRIQYGGKMYKNMSFTAKLKGVQQWPALTIGVTGFHGNQALWTHCFGYGCLWEIWFDEFWLNINLAVGQQRTG